MNGFTPEDRSRLSALLDRYCSDGESMRIDEAQAYLAALVSGPDAFDALPEAVRIGNIAGDAPLSEAEHTELAGLTGRLAAVLKQQLASGEPFELWLCDDENGRPDYFTWCNAYLYALDEVPTDWFERADDEEFEDSLLPLMALAEIYADDNGNPLFELSAGETVQAQNSLPALLPDIYRYWQAVIRKPQTFRRDGAKTGRNEPCPCGSGKKHKTCCG